MMLLPASNPGMLKDAIIYGADSIMFGLEDAVPLAEEDISCSLVFQAVKTFSFSFMETVARINSLDADGVDDVHAMVRAGIDVIRLPKATCAQDILDTEEVVLETERACDHEPSSIRMMAATKDPHGVLGAVTIAHSSRRLIDIALGSEDYVTATKTRRCADRSSEEISFAHSVIIHAAHAAGIAVPGMAFADVNDMETLRKETEFVRQLGFDGKSVIHPRRIAVANSVYIPSQKETDNALNVFHAVEEASAEGSSAIAPNGKVIDKPFVERAGCVFALARVVSVYTGPEGQEG